MGGASVLVADKKDGTTSEGSARVKSARKASRPTDGHVVDALRNAYREAVEEEIPADFLDLLGKLS